MEGQANRGAEVSGSLDELQGRMLARRRRSCLQSTAVGSLVLATIASGLGFAVVLVRHRVGPWRPVAGHAASSVQAD